MTVSLQAQHWLTSRRDAVLQYLHRAEVAINRGAEGKTGRYFVPNISEERAVELASRFVSESFLFSVSSTQPCYCIAAHGASALPA